MDKKRAMQIAKTPGLITSTVAILGLSVLFAMIAMIYLNPAFGWFSANKRTDASGFDMRTKQQRFSLLYAVKTGDAFGADTAFVANDAADLAKELQRPGDTYTFRLTIRSEDTHDIKINQIGFLAPVLGTDEVPVTENEVDYYLSTELYARVLAVNGENIASPATTYLLTLDGEGNPVLTDTPLYTFATPYTLAPGASATFVIEITFINRATDQNVYQNFGGTDNDGVCQRKIFMK